jgi:hypothetical protein
MTSVRLRLIAAWGLSIALASAILSVGISRTALVGSSPKIALTLLGARGAASAAEARAAALRGDTRRASVLARRALAWSPVHDEAIYTLAGSAAAYGDADDANRLINTAAQWGWRNADVQLWLLRQAISVADYRAAYQHADAILRQTDNRDRLFLLLAAGAHSGDSMRALLPHLEARPKWRAGFFAFGGTDKADLPGTETLLRALRTTGSAPTQEEAVPLIWRLLKMRRPAAAMKGNVLGLGWEPTEVSAATSPFGWNLPAGTEVREGAKGQPALLVTSGATPEAFASRVVALGEGHYAIEMAARPGPVTVSWTVSCQNSPVARGAQPLAIRRWRFSVPPGCGATTLTMKIATSDGGTPVSAIKLLRLP